MEVAAKWMASGLENRGTAEDIVGVQLHAANYVPLSSFRLGI